MSPVAHTALGIFGWRLFADSRNRKTLTLFIIIASLPDIDFALFFLYGKAGPGMHQLYTHNVFFVFITALFFSPLFKTGKERFGFFLVAFSHLGLDFLTIDGAAPFGFRMFYPLWEKHFNLGILPNLWKANLGDVFSIHNVLVVGFEILLFWVPLMLIYKWYNKLNWENIYDNC